MKKVFLAVSILVVFYLASCAYMYPLHVAAINGDVETVGRLLDEGADINARYYYSEQGDKEIGRGYHEFEDDHFRTVLHSAGCNIELIKLLLERGADVNGKDTYGRTPLYHAIRRDCVEAAKLLIEGGADVDGTRALLGDAKDKHYIDYMFKLSKEVAVKVLTKVEDGVKEGKRQAALKQQKLAEEKALAEQQKIAELAAEAEKNGDCGKAFQICLDYLKEHPSLEIRKRIIRLYQKLDPRPAIPAEAQKHEAFARAVAEAAAKTADEKQLDRAVEEYREALKLAPWWADAYMNAALVMEQRKLYADAARMLTLFLLAAPDNPEAQNFKDKIYMLEYKAEFGTGK